MKKQRITWTQDQIKKLSRLWNDKSSEEIANELGVERKQVIYMAYQIRKAGFELTRKRKRGELRSLIVESLEGSQLKKSSSK